MIKKKVVIIGGGFGGLNSALALKNANVEITLIDKTNHHLFQPLLYQVATAALSPGDIAAPIRAILKRQKNVRVIMDEIVEIDRKNKKVIGKECEAEFDYLIIATGARHSYFGKSEWEKFALGLKTIRDALSIREKMLISFERAERLNDPKEIEKCLTFVIVGGGPTGVEVAGAIAEISKKTMLQNFRNFDPSHTKIILLEAGERILSTYDPELSYAAQVALEELGVNVWVNKMVTGINEKGVMVGDKFIETPNVIWAAGNNASAMLKTLNAELDGSGRVIVKTDCSVKEEPNIFVIGDAANFSENNKPLPGVAPVAIQQGKYVADIITKRTPRERRKPFKYFDKGNLATIGRAKAIMEVGKFKLSGFLAWLMWGVVHIMFLISFRNKYKVMSEWLYYYLSYKHGIRLITSKTDL